jgi:hypothetical protein
MTINLFTNTMIKSINLNIIEGIHQLAICANLKLNVCPETQHNNGTIFISFSSANTFCGINIVYADSN